MESESNEQFLAEVLGHVILQTGPQLIDFEHWEAGLPEDAKGVMVEATQEGYLVFITDKDHAEEDEDV